METQVDMKTIKDKDVEMKKYRRSKHIMAIGMTTVTVAFISLFLFGNKSYASWIETENGTKYELENGEYATGFSEIDGNRYYFNDDGYLQTGKFYVEAEDAYYYANKRGIIQTGTIKTKKVFYVADEAGKLQSGFVEYENNRYYFGKGVNLMTGWFQVDGNWYYADDQGVIMTGFLTLDGYRYYLNEDGVRISDAAMEFDGITYIFNADGSVDENATTLYPIYQYISQKRKADNLQDILMNSKVQACAILRASDLVNGYAVGEETSIERLLKNRGVKCSGGYEFSYGGVEEYGIDKLLSDMEKDLNLTNVLCKQTVTEVGLGFYEKDNIFYYDIIFITAD